MGIVFVVCTEGVAAAGIAVVAIAVIEAGVSGGTITTLFVLAIVCNAGAVTGPPRAGATGTTEVADAACILSISVNMVLIKFSL